MCAISVPLLAKRVNVSAVTPPTCEHPKLVVPGVVCGNISVYNNEFMMYSAAAGVVELPNPAGLHMIAVDAGAPFKAYIRPVSLKPRLTLREQACSRHFESMNNKDACQHLVFRCNTTVHNIGHTLLCLGGIMKLPAMA